MHGVYSITVLLLFKEKMYIFAFRYILSLKNNRK